MRIGVAQINPTLGDFQGNSEKILSFVQKAVEKKCDLVVFPECALFGYHPFDLLERSQIVDQQLKAFEKIGKSIPAGVAVVLGLITKNKALRGRPYHNSAALLVKGKKPVFFHKTLLPTGDVFDEARFIEPGDMGKNSFQWKGKRFLLTICEDIWAWPDAKNRSPYKINPLSKVVKKKYDLVINLSASPWHLGKLKLRERVVQQTARHFKAPLLYVNLVGAQDEIIFDGRSFLVDAKGKTKMGSLAFQEDLNVFNLKTQESWSASDSLQEAAELHQALVLGIQDFCKKTGLGKVHLGSSGGIDSAVVTCLAVDALGPNAVKTFALPGPFSSDKSLSLAEKLAKNLSVDFDQIDITSTYEQMIRHLEKSFDLSRFGLVHENLQSRLRGLFMMTYSNYAGSLLLTTGNKSEYATGYATLYGDMCGGLAPIGDLTKQQVYQLARYYNREHEVIPKEIIDRAPSAELRPNQKDQDSLPEYNVLDAAVVRMVERCHPSTGQIDRWLLQQIFKTEFKRWQAAPILKASAHSFGRGRRYPVAHKAKE